MVRAKLFEADEKASFDPVGAWRDFVALLSSEMPKHEFEIWVNPLSLVREGKTLSLYAPNEYVMQWAKERVLPRMTSTLGIREPIRLKMGNPETARSSSAEKPAESRKNSSESTYKRPKKRGDSTGDFPYEQEFSVEVPEIASLESPSKLGLDSSIINPRFTFDHFVLGRSNELAFSAAKRVAEGGVLMGNPLTIYGPSGLGKTHLLHAIVNRMRSEKHNLRYALMTSEFFYHRLVRALRERNRSYLESFKEFFRGLDLLMVDDIQFFAKKERTQDELFHVYHALVDHGGQIVLTSDRYPRDIEDMEERLKTRFSSGLPVAVEPPDVETRTTILLRKARETFNMEFPESCAALVAERVPSNVRELEAALNKVMAHADLYQEPVSEALIYDALKEIFGQRELRVSIENIQKVVAEYYKIRVSDLLSKSRIRQIVLPRQMAMSLAKELTRLSLVEIGRSFGNRDHTTVLHAVQKIEDSKKSTYAIEVDYKNLVRRLTC